jgi:GH18 family chitinase
MKKLFIIIAAAVWLGTNGRAQLVVYDPVNNVQQILAQAEDIAKYIQMVENQVQQIGQLSDQLDQLKQYNKAFGDPSGILTVSGVSALTADLTKTTVGKTISAIEQTADGVNALAYDANGLFNQIGATFTTPSGNKINREAADYKPFEAINNATANYTNVTADVLQRRQKLKEDIAATTKALQSATTASEVQKLAGVLIGQSAALAATDKEADQAVAVSVVQDIENRNDAQKQAVAAAEQQKAEVIEAFSNYRTNFSLNVLPPLFPTATP